MVSRAPAKYRITEGLFHKSGLGDPAAEFDKARRLHALSVQSGFLSPEPVSFDEHAGLVVYRYMEGLEPIRCRYIDFMCGASASDESLEAFRQAGKVLGLIHGSLQLNGAVRWAPDEEFSRAYEEHTGRSCSADLLQAPVVVIHCDYGFSNVCLVRSGSTDRIAVIDPSGNGFVTHRSDLVAPIYVDLANFLACVEGLVPLRHYPAARWSRLEAVRHAFLGGYGESGLKVDRAVLKGAVYATASSYFHKRFGRGMRKFMALRVLFNGWKGNV